jgi:hypothetical protein
MLHLFILSLTRLLESEINTVEWCGESEYKFGRTGKGTVFAQLEVLYQHFLGGTKNRYTRYYIRIIKVPDNIRKRKIPSTSEKLCR